MHELERIAELFTGGVLKAYSKEGEELMVIDSGLNFVKDVKSISLNVETNRPLYFHQLKSGVISHFVLFSMKCPDLKKTIDKKYTKGFQSYVSGFGDISIKDFTIEIKEEEYPSIRKFLKEKGYM